MLTYDISTREYMYIIFTHECNRTCPFCIDCYRGRNEYLSWDSLQRHLAFAKAHKISTITVLGGEPTLHPEVVRFCKEIKRQGFHLVMTTNADLWYKVQELDGIVDSFNFSYYGQKIPDISQFKSDITLSVLLWKDRFKSLADLDGFIEKQKAAHSNMHLKFKTIEACNNWTEKRKDISDLICQIPFSEYKTLFGAVNVGIYRGIPFGLDVLSSDSYEHAFKGQVDGEITKHWTRSNNIKQKKGYCHESKKNG